MQGQIVSKTTETELSQVLWRLRLIIAQRVLQKQGVTLTRDWASNLDRNSDFNSLMLGTIGSDLIREMTLGARFRRMLRRVGLRWRRWGTRS